MSKSVKPIALIEKKHAGDKNYLELPAKDLLDAFGKGSHIPGSIILIKAWNEWAEGNYLEPDQKFGHQWLKACFDVLIGN